MQYRDTKDHIMKSARSIVVIMLFNLTWNEKQK